MLTIRRLSWRVPTGLRERATPGALAAVAGVLAAGVLGWALLLSVTERPGTDSGRDGASSAASGSATAAPDAADEPVGIRLQVTPDPFGDLRAVETIAAPRPVTRLRLTAPPLPADSESSLVQLVDLQITADGERVPVRWPASFRERVVTLPGPVTRLELRYRVFGASARSEQAPARRVTLSLRPAAFEALPGTTAVVRLQGAVVHNLVCLDAPRAEQLCGLDAGAAGWSTEPIAAGSSRVLALVDLPSA